MTVSEFAELAISELSYTPNGQQRLVLESLARFCSPAARQRATASRDRVFVLNGYAGTGKTSMTAALVRALHRVNVPTVLLAPTGRAAKVFSAFAGYPAYTIHRRIYRHSIHGERPGLQNNNSTGTIFIVDEASMINGEGLDGDLLSDLVQYVFSGVDCSLILLGDTAQLPPVGSLFSPAMDYDTLTSLGLAVSRATLTAIARQGQLSGILANATRMRRSMRMDPMPQPRILTSGYEDVRIVSTLDLAEEIDGAYRNDGIGETVLVTRSNRRASDFNRAIRSEVLYLDEELSAGEMLIVGKNNYFWSRKVKGLDFIANGDVAVVSRVLGTETRYGLRFADVTLTFPDRRDVTVEAKVMLDTLVGDAPALPGASMRNLFEAILADPELFAPAVPYETRIRVIRDNPYWNALQVKYAYAVTCHKAQGGQWSNVFVDLCYIAPESVGLEFYRWLYTATTRARSRIWFIKASDEV